LLTREVPFAHHNSYEKFKKAVCQNHERPPIPEICEPSLKNLIECCWDHNPEIRPPFSEIIDRLTEILVDVAVVDQESKKFWKQFFLGEEEVPCSHFEKNIYEFLNLPLEPNEDDDKEKEVYNQNSQMIHLFFARPSKSQTETESLKVNIENFGRLMLWFGPMLAVDENGNRTTILDNMRQICSKQWFYGEITTNQAVDELTQFLGDTFLIRFSESMPGWYTLSQVQRGDGVTKILHQRIKHNFPGGPYIKDRQSYPNLEDLVEKCGYTKPCISPIYKRIFQHDDGVSMYLNKDD